jgi:hypothetical protein
MVQSRAIASTSGPIDSAAVYSRALLKLALENKVARCMPEARFSSMEKTFVST